MASRISLALALLASAAYTFATLLTFSVALAITQQYGTAEEARAMLDRAAAALRLRRCAISMIRTTNYFTTAIFTYPASIRLMANSRHFQVPAW
jgi:hypothetical protein